MTKAHTDMAFTATILAGIMLLLTSTALVSPYWLWLNDQPGFTSSGAETQLDRYQGLWYSCEFIIEGTVSGVNIERRNCTAMSALVDGVTRPASIATAQAFTSISAIFTVVTIIAVWIGLGSAEGKPETAKSIASAMIVGAAASTVTAISQFIALLVYVSDDYVTATRTNAVDPALIGWGSGIGCLASSFVVAVAIAIVAALGACYWRAESSRIAQAKRAALFAATRASEAGAAARAAAPVDAEAPSAAVEDEDDDGEDTAHAAIVAAAAAADDVEAEEAAEEAPAAAEEATEEAAEEAPAAAEEAAEEAPAAAEEAAEEAPAAEGKEDEDEGEGDDGKAASA